MRQRAFTLIELLVVIAIIGILSSVVVASVNAAREKGRLAAAKSFAAGADRAAGDETRGFWNLDECSGTIATDYSGNGNNGTLTNGPTWSSNDTPTGTGCSVSFDGSSDTIDVPYSALLTPTGAVSFGAWFKFSVTPAVSQVILSKTEAGGYNLDFNDGFCPASLCALVRVGGTYHAVQYPISRLSTGKWYYAFATYDGEIFRLYLDGAEVTKNPTPSGPVTYSANNPLCIGSEPNASSCGAGGFFAGLIDGPRVYGKALTALEVQTLYAEGVDRHLADALR